MHNGVDADHILSINYEDNWGEYLAHSWLWWLIKLINNYHECGGGCPCVSPNIALPPGSLPKKSLTGLI